MHISKNHIYKIYTILSLLLLVRHSQYYIFNNIITEYGYLQPIWGITLIPVTAVFGAVFCLGREKIIKSNAQYLRILLIFFIPVMLGYFYNYEFSDLVSYNISDTSRRPPFLILIAIAITILLYDANKLIFQQNLVVLLAIATTVNFQTENFIIYYCSLMLAAGSAVNLMLKSGIIKFGYIFYILSFVQIYLFETERASNILELFFVIGLLCIVVDICAKLWLPILKFSMLEFYIMQACVFTIIPSFLKNWLGFSIVLFSVYLLLSITGRLKFVSWR